MYITSLCILEHYEALYFKFPVRPEGAFCFEVSEGPEMPWRKKGKMETNKQRNKIKQILFPQIKFSRNLFRG